jgi:hypothetical protein
MIILGGSVKNRQLVTKAQKERFHKETRVAKKKLEAWVKNRLGE